MKRLIITIIVFLFLSSTAMADAILDGNFWKTLSDYPEEKCGQLCKLTFVRGVYDGMGFTAGLEMKKLFYMEGEGKDFYGNLVYALDKFYSDYKNINITVVEALIIISMELRGASQKEIEELKEYSRKRNLEKQQKK